MKNKKDYVWYASYGSNINEERFLCYIKGGKPKGAKRVNPGCSDKSLPLKTKKIIINHELYFAKESKTWNKGGVAFLKNKANPKRPTFGKMYLITKKQFKEVVKQENNGVSAGFKFKKVIANGSKIILKDSWYGRIINLGNHKGYPIFTFTNSNNLVNTNKPSKAYLKTILKGIQSAHKVDHQVLSTYTKRLNGTKEITPKKIKRLLK